MDGIDLSSMSCAMTKAQRLPSLSQRLTESSEDSLNKVGIVRVVIRETRKH
jgi:hypothetical protein